MPQLDHAIEAYIDKRLEVLDALKRILIEKLKIDREPREIDPDTPLFGTGLQLDSIDAVELWVSVGERFGFLPPDDVRRVAAMRTLNTLTDLVLSMAEGATDDAQR
ncbi:MAG: acyl carrier protein [Myxococcales bacterium]|nr:MAG: acyl carrier protein [Myxococcales bacterium]